MNKVLIAVDETKSSKAVLYSFYNLIKKPDEVILLHVERLEGDSLMIDMLGDAELTTLKDSLKGTDHKEKLDSKADRILNYYRKELGDGGTVRVKAIVREGRAADEVLKVADEEGAEMIILGYRGSHGLSSLMTGSVTREVEKRAKVPVLVARKPVMCEEPYTWRDAYYAISFFAVVVLLLFFLGRFLTDGGAILPSIF